MLAVFIALIVAGRLLFPPREHTAAFVAYVLVSIALLLAICWIKGEPPRWRWGK